MIKLFKFISGEEIVAKIVQEERDGYRIKNPIQFVMQPSENGMNIIPMPWMQMSADKEMYIMSHSLALKPMTPEERIIEFYNHKFGEIIVPMNAGQIHV